MRTLSVRGFDDIERFPDVETADDEFLDAKSNHLDALDIIISHTELASIGAKV